MTQTISAWDLGKKAQAPCADISYASLPERRLRLVMHFSRIREGIPHDLEIVFEQAYAMVWHEEALHSVSASLTASPS